MTISPLAAQAVVAGVAVGMLADVAVTIGVSSVAEGNGDGYGVGRIGVGGRIGGFRCPGPGDASPDESVEHDEVTAKNSAAKMKGQCIGGRRTGGLID